MYSISSVECIKFSKPMEPKKPALLIDRLEDYAERYPSRYRFRVALLAVLGYAYLLAVIAGLLALVWAMGYVFVALEGKYKFMRGPLSAVADAEIFP